MLSTQFTLSLLPFPATLSSLSFFPLSESAEEASQMATKDSQNVNNNFNLTSSLTPSNTLTTRKNIATSIELD